MITLDNKIVNYFLSRTDAFKNIHPNWITAFGFGINIILFSTIINKLLLATLLFLIVRYFSDLLDGAVARRYNKVTKLGGIFDSVSDNILIFVLVYSIGILLNVDYIFFIALTVTAINLMYMVSENSFVDHEPIKHGKGILKGTYSFFVNNNCISYSLVYIIILGITL